MRITAVRATWLRAPIPAEHAHVSDFGRNDSFNTTLVRIDTGEGLVYRHINNGTCVMLLHIHPETRSWPCGRPNSISPMRIAS